MFKGRKKEPELIESNPNTGKKVVSKIYNFTHCGGVYLENDKKVVGWIKAFGGYTDGYEIVGEKYDDGTEYMYPKPEEHWINRPNWKPLEKKMFPWKK